MNCLTDLENKLNLTGTFLSKLLYSYVSRKLINQNFVCKIRGEFVDGLPNGNGTVSYVIFKNNHIEQGA